jgi:hypothetical protein
MTSVLFRHSCKNVTLLLSNYGFIWYHVKYTDVINLDVMWNTLMPSMEMSCLKNMNVIKSIGFQIPLRNKYVPILVKIHWSMLMLDCSQGCYTVKTIDPVTLTFDIMTPKYIGFFPFHRGSMSPSLVRIRYTELKLLGGNLCGWFPCGRGRTLFIFESLGQRPRSLLQ